MMFCCASDKTGVVASKDKRIVFRLPPAAGHGDSPCGSRGGRPGPSWTASAPTSRTGVFFSTAAKLPRPGRHTATPLNLELADFQYEGTVNLLQRTGHRRPHGARRTSGALRKILEGRPLLFGKRPRCAIFEVQLDLVGRLERRQLHLRPRSRGRKHEVSFTAHKVPFNGNLDTAPGVARV